MPLKPDATNGASEYRVEFENGGYDCMTGGFRIMRDTDIAAEVDLRHYGQKPSEYEGSGYVDARERAEAVAHRICNALNSAETPRITSAELAVVLGKDAYDRSSVPRTFKLDERFNTSGNEFQKAVAYRDLCATLELELKAAEDRYQSAVHGRSEFRKALKTARQEGVGSPAGPAQTGEPAALSSSVVSETPRKSADIAYCPTCEKEWSQTERKDIGMGATPAGMVLVSRNFLEATPCPNKNCSDGAIISTGPDPIDEPCQWCYEKHMILSGAVRAPSAIEAKPAPGITTWYCGCGHTNGVNLAHCAACQRTPAGRHKDE